MARKNQRLINYHTGGKTTMPNGSDVHYGEIVVRHNEEAPELLIKVGEESFGVFQASGAVKTAIDTAISAAKSEVNGNISALEQSLSGHVADFEAFQTEVENTYATKTKLETAETNITTAYTKAIGDAKDEVYDSATTFATSAVTVAKGELNSAINDVASDLEVLSGVVESVTTNIGDNYVSKDAIASALTQVSSDINSAKDAAITSGKTYTDAEIVKAKEYTNTQIGVSETKTNGLIEGVESQIEELSETVNTNAENAAKTYATKTELSNAQTALTQDIATAKAEATNASSAYTDAQIALAKKYTDEEIASAEARVKQVTDGLDSKVNTLSGNVHTTIEALEGELTDVINNKVAVAYRYQGTVTNYTDLPTSDMSDDTIGYVYNVVNANGDFPAGTNYAWNGTTWDALGGSIDLSPYAKTSDVNATVNGINQRIQSVESSVSTLSGNTDSAIASLKQYADETFATKIALQTAQEDITTAYTKAISDAKAEVYTSATTFANNVVTAATATLNQNIQAVDGRVTNLSGVTETVKATADSAVQTASVDCGVTVNKVGTELQFSFADLVIDCGEF